MRTAAEDRVPLRVGSDDVHGGRWTTLSGGGREWLWRRPGTRRNEARPGDPFVDAGGLEECLPTVRGRPDHGEVWSRRWRSSDACTATIERPDFTLTRRLTDDSGVVVADYRLQADPGYRFLWAAHALLDLSPAARLEAPAGIPVRLYPEAGALPSPDQWPPDGRWLPASWPSPAGLPLDRLGPDDGTAVGAVLLDCPRVRVADGTDRLTLHLECDDQPRSTALWRNLRGWPSAEPYRSIGVEPMLGRVFDLAGAGPGDAAEVPSGGAVTWRLTLTAHRAD
ncbi:hypothetical protein [Rhizomonospora bruguierae]|uniref:hypothetical protein n=1 Tax=Rhizomonospora bruguierae TaxID=1581705 RepID=UPI0020C09F9A|nr:hypothetical protein [Micromonospora sp. NBRC 107566]